MEKKIFTISVDAEYYKKHYNIFKPPNTELKSAIIIDDSLKNNKTHKILLKKYLKARDDLRNYEYDVRYNYKRKK